MSVVNTETIKRHKTSILLNFYVNCESRASEQERVICAANSVHACARPNMCSHSLHFKAHTIHDSTIHIVHICLRRWLFFLLSLLSLSPVASSVSYVCRVRMSVSLIWFVSACFCFRSLIFTAILSLCCVLSCVINGFGSEIAAK